MTLPLFDNRLRPASELIPAVVMGCLSAVLWMAPAAFFPFSPTFVQFLSLLVGGYAAIRAWQGLSILRYRNGLICLPRYQLQGKAIPWSRHRLFLGRGFQWRQQHSQRLLEARSPDAASYLKQSTAYRLARWLEIRGEKTKALTWLLWLTRLDSHWNPLRPLPPIGGNSLLHGVGLAEETPVWMDVGERVGHTLVLGTTRVGKTRLAELLIAQDIRRGEVVIVIDPKGDIDLLRRVYAEVSRANRLHHFHLFHLGYPQISERYNPVGEFTRITEVASRTTNPLPDTGTSATFKAFAWRFANIVARALVGLGRKPDYTAIARYVTNIEPLFVDYLQYWLDRQSLPNWRQAVQAIENDDSLIKRIPNSLKSADRHAIALWEYYRSNSLFDAIIEGLKGIMEYEKTYYDKLTASLLPLLEKLTSGQSGELLTPNYTDHLDSRSLLNWRKVIREGGVAYIGLDALTDAAVASAVGSSMFSDLTSVAGELYKFGDTRGLPTIKGYQRPKIALHADEFNEIVSPDFIPMVNKAGGAGVQITAYTQTASDVEAGIGSRPQAGQIFGNFNTLLMLRVQNEETARILTDKLAKVRLFTKVPESRITDSSDLSTSVDFTSQNLDKITETEAPLLDPSDLVQLPKGQAFALLEGGQLYKLRLPLAGADKYLPKDMNEIIAERLRFYYDSDSVS